MVVADADADADADLPVCQYWLSKETPEVFLCPVRLLLGEMCACVSEDGGGRLVVCAFMCMHRPYWTTCGPLGGETGQLPEWVDSQAGWRASSAVLAHSHPHHQ